MSKNANGYMGIQVGKLGPAVGFMWKGKNIYRAYNPFAKDANTPKQQLQRALFRVISKTSRLLSPAINLGYAYKANSLHTTTRGLFVKDNFQYTSGDSPENVEIDLSKLTVSDGPLTPPIFGTPAYNPSNACVDIPFVGNVGIGCALDNDEIMVYGFCPDLEMATFTSAAREATDPLSLPVPDAFRGHDVYIYGFAATMVDEPTFVESYNGTVYPKMCSVSRFIGTLPLQ